MFNRGQHNPDIFPEVEKLRGDRRMDLGALKGKSWDAVIDTSGYLPSEVRLSTQSLVSATDLYCFISTISVFAGFEKRGQTEDSPLAQMTPEMPLDTVAEGNYGPLKAMCETIVRDAFPAGSLIVRPGLIVGPHDPTNRFTYWPVRVARGGEVLAPMPPEQNVQFVDVRDLAEFTVSMVEENRTDVFNVTGQPRQVTLVQLLDLSKTQSGSDATYCWVDQQFLLDENVAPWTDLPLWIQDAEGWRGFAQFDVGKAVAAGLTFIELEKTVRDTLDWASTLAEDTPRPNGLTQERESELLAKWKAQAPVAG